MTSTHRSNTYAVVGVVAVVAAGAVMALTLGIESLLSAPVLVVLNLMDVI